jgi:hypothetical protein
MLRTLCPRCGSEFDALAVCLCGYELRDGTRAETLPKSMQQRQFELWQKYGPEIEAERALEAAKRAEYRRARREQQRIEAEQAEQRRQAAYAAHLEQARQAEQARQQQLVLELAREQERQRLAREKRERQRREREANPEFYAERPAPSAKEKARRFRTFVRVKNLAAEDRFLAQRNEAAHEHCMQLVERIWQDDRWWPDLPESKLFHIPNYK